MTNYIKNQILFILRSISLLMIIFYLSINAQTMNVQGKVTAIRYPVKNALVIFIDNSDTTRQFSALTNASGNYTIGLPTSAESDANNLPTKFELAQSYPNPFNLETAIPYKLNKESEVQVTIYDILGKVVRKFNVGRQSIGTYNVLWNGRNGFGQKVASGIYFYRLNAGGESQVKKMIFNESGKGLVSLPRFTSLQISESNRLPKQNILSGTYKIRIENTSTTSPLIIPQEFNNIILRNDTTISFTVNYVQSASINLDSIHQIIRGFGAANIVGWRPDMTSNEIDAAFGAEEGQLGFTILRLRISPNPNDWINSVSSARVAYDLGATIIASPWSPPASMKTNNSLVGGELREDAYDDYAAHLNSFVDFMADNGVPIYAVSVQNEPDIEVTYESCDWSPSQMLKFMKENANTIETKVMAPESFQFRRSMSDPILNDPIAVENLGFVAGHIYGGGSVAYPLAKQKGKEVWMTEYLINSPGSGTNMDTSWTAALETAKSINRCMSVGMSAYVWWYIVRYYGPIDDGTYNSAGKGSITRKGYAMSQFSRFIRPGFYRVESSISPTSNSVEVTAYKDPSSSKVVIVAVNSGTTQVENVFRIQNGGVITFTPYTTSETKNCNQGEEVNVTNGSFTYTLEPSSITTFVSN